MNATYISSNQFSVSGDRTLEFVTGRRLRADCDTDGIKYLTVQSSSYSVPNTTITTVESELTSNLLTVLYGIIEPGESGSLPNHSHNGAEGGGGLLDEPSFLDLTDTPSTYTGADGKFLQATTSGVIFTDLNISSNTVYARYVMSAGQTITTSVSNRLDFETKEVDTHNTITTGSSWVFTAPYSGYYGCFAKIQWDQYSWETNNDLHTISINIGSVNKSVDYATPNDLGQSVLSGFNIAYCNAGDTIYATVFQNSGSDRTLRSSSSSLYNFIEIFSLDSYSPPGSDLINSARGIQSIKVEYNTTTSGLNFNPGLVYVNDGSTERFYQISSQFSDTPTIISSDAWYYIYVNPTNLEITVSGIEYSTTKAVLDIDRYGYYHPTSSGLRCIGVIKSNAAPNIRPFVFVGNDYRFGGGEYYTPDLAGGTSTSFTDITSTAPFGGILATYESRFNYISASDHTNVRLKGDTSNGFRTGSVDANSIYSRTIFDMPIDSDQKFQYKTLTGGGQLSLWLLGCVLPELIYSSIAGPVPITDDDLINLYKGHQSIEVEYATVSGVYINPGKIEINDVLYKVTSQFTKQLTLSANTWYYIYAKPPTSGKIITNSEIEYTSTVPTEDLSRMGWFHGTNTSWRCIGAVQSNSSANVREFLVDNDHVWWITQATTNINGTDVGDSSSPNTVTWTLVPKFSRRAHATFYTDTFSSNSILYYSIYSGVIGQIATYFHTSGRAQRDMQIVFCTENQEGYVWEDTSTSNTFSVIQNGYFLPDSIYNR